MPKRRSKKTPVRLHQKLVKKAAHPKAPFAFVGAFVAFGLVVVLVSHAATTVTAGATGLLAGGLRNGAGTVMCLDDYQNSSVNGAHINVYPCNKSDGGQKFVPYSDGTIRIHSKCVAVSGNSNANGARLV